MTTPAAKGGSGGAATIRCFCHQGRFGGDVLGRAIDEEGRTLVTHCSSNEDFSKHDMGYRNSDWHHEEYRRRYPDGFKLVWLDEPPLDWEEHPLRKSPAPQSGPAGATFILPPQDIHPAMLADIRPGDAWSTDVVLTRDQIKEVDDYLAEKFGLKRCEPFPSAPTPKNLLTETKLVDAPSSGKAEGVEQLVERCANRIDNLLSEEPLPIDEAKQIIREALTAAAAELEATINETYKRCCGRDYMHLPLADAVWAVMEKQLNEEDKLRAQLTSTRDLLREREAEVKGLIEHGCEALMVASAMLSIWGDMMSPANIKTFRQHEKEFLNRAQALTPPPPPAVDGRRGEGV